MRLSEQISDFAVGSRLIQRTRLTALHFRSAGDKHLRLLPQHSPRGPTGVDFPPPARPWFSTAVHLPSSVLKFPLPGPQVWTFTSCSLLMPDTLLNSQREPGHQPLVVYPIEEVLQIDIHHPSSPSFRYPLASLYRCMAASPGPKPVTCLMECRLVLRLQYLPHRFLHHPVHHVGYAQSPLPASCLRYPHAPDFSSLVTPVLQRLTQCWQHLLQPLAHLPDALPIRSAGTLVGRHRLKRALQSLDHLLHGRRHRTLAFAL